MEIVHNLLGRGVRIPDPAGVEIDPDIDLDRVSGDGVVIHSGCRILGKHTLILPGVELGREGPVTIENCLIGPGVQLKGGFFSGAVFLEKAVCGLGAHVREGTIMEEQSTIAHTVGLKQTILFPFVTLGSLINFCDCLMSGGTDRKNHSEVGSSYIHFNFTPNQDKATPSLIGDVPHGVMLNQPPIFLGGQGGMVGPVRLNFGVTVAAGTILRQDELRPDRLIIGGPAKAASIEFRRGRYSGSARIIRNNLIYVGNLAALMQWYRQVRSLFVQKSFPEPLLQGLIGNLRLAIEERMQRLEELSGKLSDGGDYTLRDRWASIEQSIQSRLEEEGDQALHDIFQGNITSAMARSGRDYLTVIKDLTLEEAGPGTAWLQSIVDPLVTAGLSSLK